MLYAVNYIVFATLIAAVFLVVYTAVVLNHSDGEHRVTGLSISGLVFGIAGIFLTFYVPDRPSQYAMERRRARGASA